MKIILFANTDWYLYNFRKSLAFALLERGHDVLLLSPDGPFVSRLKAEGLRWRAVPMDRRSLNPWREAGLLFHLWRCFRDEKPDLVHGFTIKCVIYSSLVARCVGAIARVNAVAGMGYVFVSHDLKARLLRPLVRTLFKTALGGGVARLVLQNRDDVELFEAASLVDPSTIRLIPGSGVDVSRFRPAGRVRSHPVRVLLFARLLRDKGVGEFVQAARILRREGLPIRFVLAGSPDNGNPASISEFEIQSWVNEGAVEWLGHVEDIPALLAAMDIVTLPSYREGLPKGLIEAAACGLPLIACDVPGCREVITDGVDGLLVEPRDPGALANAVRKLFEEPQLAVRFGIAARAKAVDRFDEKIIIDQTLKVYEEVAGPACLKFR